MSEYGFLLKIPVYFDGETDKRIVNNQVIPWRQSLSMADDIMEFGEQVFDETFLDVIPLIGDDMRGYAYISTRQTSANTLVRHKIFLRNMYVTDEGRDLIPKWAFFTRCIINLDDLTPNASREGFTKDHKLLKAKGQIEKCIFDYFVSLSQYDVRKLKQLAQIHNVAIKSLVIENEQIFKLFFPFLTFPTNQGILTGFQIVNASKKVPVSYCLQIDDFRRLSPLLEGTGSLLVNGGYLYDAGILQKLPKYYKNVKITVFDNSSYDNLLADATAEQAEALEGFLNYARQGLEKSHCGVALKKFSPVSLQALYVQGEDALFHGTMDNNSFSNFFEGFDFGDLEDDKSKDMLYLNSENSFVQSLGQVQDAPLAHSIIQVIYIQALLAGHYTLGGAETELMNRSLQQLMEYALYGSR